jgi:hypothetical protein
MKKWTFLIALLLACSCAFAQADNVMVWNKWCSKKDTALLFTAANNVIMVCSPTLKSADIKLKSLDNGLRIGDAELNGDTVSVMAMPYPAKSKNLRLAILNKKTNKLIKTINFACDSVPHLVARVGNIHDSEAARKYILSQITLRTAFPNSLYSYPYRIRQYTFKISTPKGSASINVNGFFMTKDVLEQIKDAPLNTVVEFTNIKVTCPECITKDVGDIRLKIK